MKTTSIQLDDAQAAWLEKQAKTLEVPKVALVRRGLDLVRAAFDAGVPWEKIGKDG